MINRTKLFTPIGSENDIFRKIPHQTLSSAATFPLVLVSAPMAYGKSSLVSSWLNINNKNHFWYSLDNFDNNFQQFILYLSKSIPDKYISFHQDIKILLNSPNQQSFQLFVDLFTNAFNKIQKDYYIILDDYHLIKERSINDFLIHLLKSPSEHIQFIIITRRDPLFPLPIWRLKDKMVEIRVGDLEFDIDEIKDFVAKNSELELNNKQIKKLKQVTEGWISGLRLWLLSNKNEKRFDLLFNSKQNDNSSILKELILDVLHTYPEERNIILKISILDQFKSDLVKVLVSNDEKQKVDGVITLLKKSNLFLIPLDDKLQWFRLHHMFQDYLHQILVQEVDQQSYFVLHRKAAQWYIQNGDFEKGIQHYIKAEDFEKAIDSFSIIRCDLLNQNNWIELTNILNQYPKKIIETSIELQLIKSWILIHTGKVFELFDSLEELGVQIENDSSKNKLQYKAELKSLLPYKTYTIDQDFDACIEQCEFALDNLDKKSVYPKGYSWIFLGGSLQIKGKAQKALDLIDKELKKNTPVHLEQNLLLILNYIFWMEADLPSLYKSSKKLIHLAKTNNKPEALMNGYYFLASFYFIQHDLKNAEFYFKKLYAQRHLTIGAINYFGSVAYVLTLLEIRKTNKALSIIDTLESEVILFKNPYYIKLIDLARAEYYLTVGKVDIALQLAKGTEKIPLVPFSNIIMPSFSFFKVFLYKTELSQVENIIKNTSSYLIQTHNKLFDIYIKLYEVLLLNERQKIEEALNNLKIVITTASELNIARPFFELSSYLKPLLINLKNEYKNNLFYQKIVKPYNKLNKYNFTRRELEVLPLLQLSDKEISKKLFIAVKTVKRHNGNIFKKLNVNKRIDAYYKAKNIGVIV